MDFKELITEAFGTLTVNKLRTGLAVLGIIIGIGSVITLISLGAGSQQAVQAQIQSLGANLLTVVPGGQNAGAVRGALGGGTTLTLEDAASLRNSPGISTIKNISPELSRRAQVTSGRNNTNTQVIGVYPEYNEVHKVNIATGSFIEEKDVTGLGKVAVLGPQVISDLFGEDADPLGQQIRINGQNLKIIGTTVSKGGSGFQNQDDIIFVPLTTAQKILFGANYISSVSVEANSPEVMTDAQNQIGYHLLSRHKLSDPSEADFSIFSQNDILATASQVTGTFTTLLGGIAAISLLVGGIGIMNIMLVTVTERTREIGLRKALGATKRIITVQFLMESIILTFVGGIIGMLLGIGSALALSLVLAIPFTVKLNAILLAISVSGGIGILFGWYPAKLAANLQPIEALRYE